MAIPHNSQEGSHGLQADGQASFRQGFLSQIGLVRGQFGNVDMNHGSSSSPTRASTAGGSELELDLARCDTTPARKPMRKNATPFAQKHGLEIFTIATHLQGQALAMSRAPKTLQFTGGEAVEMYKRGAPRGTILRAPILTMS